VRGPGGFTGGRVVDAMVTHLDVYPTLCDLAGVAHPPWLQGRSLLPLVQGKVDHLHDEVFSELTYHAAYDPERAIRTDRWKYIRIFHDHPHPVLPNCDDSAAKDVLLANGWADTVIPREQLYDLVLFFYHFSDLVLDPAEAHNLSDDPAHADVVADLRGRLEAWMRATDDPLLDGPVPAPVGAVVNEVDQISPDDPLRTVTE
jgi:N-sulfoglucosamine sulfohydrolase